VFAQFGEDNIEAENALRSALATLDIAASAIIVGIDQTGRIRGNRHATTIDAGMTPTSVGSERTPADARRRSTTPRLSTEELQRAREYLARPETRQYLRARELLHTRTQQPREAVAIEARHVATVFRELAGERGSRSLPTPPTTMRVPSTKRVIEAAVAVANGEAAVGNQLSTASRRVAHGSQQTPGHAIGHGRA
jgi:hypothetical protein